MPDRPLGVGSCSAVPPAAKIWMRDADERSASHSLSHKNVPPSSSSSMLENFCYTSPIDAGAARSSHRAACRAGPGPRPGWAGLGGAGRGPGRVTAPGNDDTRAKSDYLASQQSCRIDRRRNNTREHGEFFISAAEPRSLALALSSSINYASTTQPTNSRLFIFARACTHVLIIYCLRFSRLHDFRQIAYRYCSAVVAEILSG